MKQAVFIIALALTVLITSCSPISSGKIKNELEQTLEISEENGRGYVTVTSVDGKANVSVHLTSKVSIISLTTYITKSCAAVSEILDDVNIPFYRLSCGLFDSSNNPVVIWSTYDFTSGTLLDYRNSSTTTTDVAIEELHDAINSPPPEPSAPTEKSMFAAYVENNDIKLSAKDVQFDMANNLNEYFALSGTATLSNYYNYGFDSNLEKDYFCMLVTPNGGSYSDSWYIYCHRESFSGLFNLLKSESRYVQTVCIIPNYRYEQNQSMMAQLHYVVY